MSKISSGAIMLAFVAVLFGLFGAYVVREVLNRPRTQRVERKVEVVTVPMASMDLKSGRTVTLGDVALARMTRAEMKAKGISRAFMTDTKQIIGRVLQSDVKRGSRFDTTLFYPDGMRPGLGDRLKPGMRGVTVAVWAGDALLGFAGPGNWVDVIFRSGSGGEGSEYGDRFNSSDDNYPAWQDYTRDYARTYGKISRNRHRRGGYYDRMEQTVTLLEKVQVLAVDRETFEGMSVESPQSERLSVTLAVTPEQAATLRVVNGRGELSLALRSPDDNAKVQDTAPRTMKDIIDIPEEEPYEELEMEVYRGFRREQIDFVGTGLGSRRGRNNGMWYANQDTPESDSPTVHSDATRNTSSRIQGQRSVSNDLIPSPR